MKQSTRLDRARGCTVGQAIGDALGGPLEGLSRQQIQQCYGTVDDFVDGIAAWRKKPLRWRLKGLYSDDTQQALVLAQCLIECGRIEPKWVASMYLALASPKGGYLGAHRGAGTSFRKVLIGLERGMGPLGAAQPSAGSTAASRIAPVGLFEHESDEAFLADVLSASRMTHCDQRSLAGAFAVASAVRMLAGGAERTPAFLFHLAHQVSRAEDAIADRYGAEIQASIEHRHAISIAIAHVESLLERPRDQAYAAIMGEANRHGPENDCRRPTMGFATACIPTCLYVLLTTESFEDALVEIVNLGGDADTAGSILGAMAGALYGERAVPSRWLDAVRNREGLALRGQALVDRDTEVIASIPPLLETERQLTREDTTMREAHLPQRKKGDDLGANRWWR